MRNQTFSTVTGVLLVLVISFSTGCEQNAIVSPDQIGISKSAWEAQGQFIDDQGKIRVPTFFTFTGIAIVEGKKVVAPSGKSATIYLAQKDWAILTPATSLKKSSTTCIYEYDVYTAYTVAIAPLQTGFVGVLSDFCPESMTIKHRGEAKTAESESGGFKVYSSWWSYDGGYGDCNESSHDVKSTTFSSPPYAAGWYSSGTSTAVDCHFSEDACDNGGDTHNAVHFAAVDNLSSSNYITITDWRNWTKYM